MEIAFKPFFLLYRLVCITTNKQMIKLCFRARFLIPAFEPYFFYSFTQCGLLFCLFFSFCPSFPGPPPFPLNHRKCGSLGHAPCITISCLTAIWRHSSRYPLVVVYDRAVPVEQEGKAARAFALVLFLFSLLFLPLPAALDHDITPLFNL